MWRDETVVHDRSRTVIVMKMFHRLAGWTRSLAAFSPDGRVHSPVFFSDGRRHQKIKPLDDRVPAAVLPSTSFRCATTYPRHDHRSSP